MLNRDDFNAKLEATIGKYPELAARRQAGDPALTQHLDAVFTAFAMLSANQELALAEPHAKTRPATVLADAALRGIIAKATPAVVMVRVRNEGISSYSIAEGRIILDTAGRPYRAAYAVTVPGDSELVVKFVQSRAEVVVHNIATPAEFYATSLPTPDDDSELSAIRVFHTNGNEMVYKQDYVGVEPGELAYHVEVNAEKTVFVRFGDGESVGYMVQAGDAFRIEADYCAGEVSLDVQEPFEFEYTATPRDVFIALELESVNYKGAPAQSIDALRELCKYPAIYDDDAVFLGEFDYLLNKHFPSADFLSVWNEAIEEKHRGYDLVNTNSLFVACVDSDGSEITVGSEGGEVPLIGLGSPTRDAIIVGGNSVWEQGGALSITGHSEGKRTVKISFPEASGLIARSNFYFGLATDDTNIGDRPFDPNVGAMALFTQRHGGASSQTGVMSEWYNDGLTSPRVNINPADDLSYDDDYFIDLDADADQAVFYVLRDGSELWRLTLDLPSGKEWHLVIYNHDAYNNFEYLRIQFDLTASTFDLKPGYDAWDDTYIDEPPRILSEGEWTPFQRAIADKIKQADDTLRTRFYTPKLEPIPVEVVAQIPSSYVPADVEQAIRELLIQNYGKTSAFAQSGGVIKTRETIEQLVEGIPALSAQSADVSVNISAPEGSAAPEVWRFVSDSSIDVSLTVASGRRSGW